MSSATAPKIYSMDAFINTFRKQNTTILLLDSEYLLNMEFSLTFIQPKIYS
ncbi:MAG: hypothetical protein FD143_3030 [Ignavibacteria bacterium]|nr:MAG: hypothetical protein FD143_3030 [Ignavibacteria bacterium]